MCTQVLMCMLSRVQLFVTLWTVAHQAPPSTGFSRQKYCSRFPFPPPGDLPNPAIKPVSLTLAGRFFTAEPPGKPTSRSKPIVKYVRDSQDYSQVWGFTKTHRTQHVVIIMAEIGYSEKIQNQPMEKWMSEVQGKPSSNFQSPLSLAHTACA